MNRYLSCMRWLVALPFANVFVILAFLQTGWGGEWVLNSVEISGSDISDSGSYDKYPLEYSTSYQYVSVWKVSATISHSISSGSLQTDQVIESIQAPITTRHRAHLQSNWPVLPASLKVGTVLTPAFRLTVTDADEIGSMGPLVRNAVISYTISSGQNDAQTGSIVYEPAPGALPFSQSASLTYTVPAASTNKTLGLTVGTAHRLHDRTVYRYLYYLYSWRDDADSSGYGSPFDNPHTIFRGGHGPGVCSEMGLPKYWVNTSSLDLIIEDSDLSYDSLGPGVATTRLFNAFADPNRRGMFYDGWSFAYQAAINRFCNGALLQMGNGKTAYFNTTANACDTALTYPVSFSPPSGSTDSLSYYGTYFVHTERSGYLQRRFDRVGDTTMYRLSSITDANGNKLMLTYNSDGTLQKLTDAAGRIISFTYDWAGRCTSMISPSGAAATYTYSASNALLSQSVDLYGTAVDYSYDRDGYLTALAVNGRTTTFTYTIENGWKHLASVTDAAGETTTYTVVTASPRVVRVTDPEGKSTIYYSSAGKTTKVIDALGNTTTTVFTNGQPAKITDPKSGVTTLTYDSRGNLTQQTNPLGQSITYTYDASGNMIAIKNALNQTSTYAYDGRHNLLTSTSPQGRATTLTYTAKGLPASVTDPAGRITRSTYDTFGNVKTVTDPTGNITTYGYDSLGLNQTSVTDPSGYSTTYSYDNNRRLTRIVHPDGSNLNFEYDACTLTAFTDERGKTTTFSRDKMQNITAITDPAGKILRKSYDSTGNLLTITDPLNRIRSNTYDAVNRRITSLSPLGSQVAFTYDSNNNLTALTNEHGKKTVFTYTSTNLLASTTDPANRTSTIARDVLGRMTTRTTARGNVLGFTYDADGRMTGKSRNGTTAATYTYDGAGNMLTVTDATGILRYTRDTSGRITRITYPDGKIASFSYLSGSQVGTISYPGGFTVTYAYNNRTRPTSISWSGGLLSPAYDAAGNLTADVRANGTRTDVTYDAVGRVTDIQHKNGNTTLARMTYNRNAVGNTETETTTLSEPALQTGTEKGSYNSAGQITSFGADRYTSDQDGNITAIAGSRNWTIVHNAENLLTSLNRNGVTTTYSYNGLGQRIRSQTGSRQRNFHYDPLGRLLFETNESNQVTVCYIYDQKRLVALRDGSGATQYYHADKTGNTVLMTNGAGAISQSYTYLPYGEVIDRSGTVINPFTFAGAYGVLDEGGGLYFMSKRYYDAHTGRFLEQDPVGFAGGSNQYAYVGGNPVEKIDPEGLLFGFDAGEEYTESWQQFFAEVVEQPVGDGLLAKIGGYTKKCGAYGLGTLSSLWTRNTSEATVMTIGAGACAFAFAAEYAACSAMSAEIFAASAEATALSPGTVSLGSLLAASAGEGNIVALVRATATTPAGRATLLAIQKQAAALAQAAIAAGETTSLQRLTNVIYWAGRFL